jgi:hypothetical protein
MNIDIPVRCGLEGRYRLIVRKADTEEVTKDTGWFKNLILDSGLNRMGTASFMTHCQVGTSNVAPAVAQGNLSADLAGTATVQSTVASTQAAAPYYGKMVRIYRFAAGVATGTLAEVGVGWGIDNVTSPPGQPVLFSRALITDTSGNPTTITVLPDEVLDVVYELRQYPDLIDKVFMAVISGVTYDCVLRAALVTTDSVWADTIDDAFGPYLNTSSAGIVYNGTLQGITQDPSGSSDSAESVPTSGAYTNGTYQRTMSAFWGLTRGNLAGGITALSMRSTRGGYKMSFSPPIPKDNTKTLTLTMRFFWARYTP